MAFTRPISILAWSLIVLSVPPGIDACTYDELEEVVKKCQSDTPDTNIASLLSHLGSWNDMSGVPEKCIKRTDHLDRVLVCVMDECCDSASDDESAFQASHVEAGARHAGCDAFLDEGCRDAHCAHFIAGLPSVCHKKLIHDTHEMARKSRRASSASNSSNESACLFANESNVSETHDCVFEHITSGSRPEVVSGNPEKHMCRAFTACQDDIDEVLNASEMDFIKNFSHVLDTMRCCPHPSGYNARCCPTLNVTPAMEMFQNMLLDTAAPEWNWGYRGATAMALLCVALAVAYCGIDEFPEGKWAMVGMLISSLFMFPVVAGYLVGVTVWSSILEKEEGYCCFTHERRLMCGACTCCVMTISVLCGLSTFALHDYGDLALANATNPNATMSEPMLMGNAQYYAASITCFVGLVALIMSLFIGLELMLAFGVYILLIVFALQVQLVAYPVIFCSLFGVACVVLPFSLAWRYQDWRKDTKKIANSKSRRGGEGGGGGADVGKTFGCITLGSAGCISLSCFGVTLDCFNTFIPVLSFSCSFMLSIASMLFDIEIMRMSVTFFLKFGGFETWNLNLHLMRLPAILLEFPGIGWGYTFIKFAILELGVGFATPNVSCASSKYYVEMMGFIVGALVLLFAVVTDLMGLMACLKLMSGKVPKLKIMKKEVPDPVVGFAVVYNTLVMKALQIAVLQSSNFCASMGGKIAWSADFETLSKDGGVFCDMDADMPAVQSIIGFGTACVGVFFVLMLSVLVGKYFCMASVMQQLGGEHFLNEESLQNFTDDRQIETSWLNWLQTAIGLWDDDRNTEVSKVNKRVEVYSEACNFNPAEMVMVKERVEQANAQLISFLFLLVPGGAVPGKMCTMSNEYPYWRKKENSWCLSFAGDKIDAMGCFSSWCMYLGMIAIIFGAPVVPMMWSLLVLTFLRTILKQIPPKAQEWKVVEEEEQGKGITVYDVEHVESHKEMDQRLMLGTLLEEQDMIMGEMGQQWMKYKVAKGTADESNIPEDGWVCIRGKNTTVLEKTNDWPIQGEVWKVGKDVTVRTGDEDKKKSSAISDGALVEKVKLENGMLTYRLLVGTGPETGSISVSNVWAKKVDDDLFSKAEGQVWRVIEGDNKDKSGLLVRDDKQKDVKKKEALCIGALVEEVNMTNSKNGDLMQYKLLGGTGASEGWIRVQNKDKGWAEKLDKPEGKLWIICGTGDMPVYFDDEQEHEEKLKPGALLVEEEGTDELHLEYKLVKGSGPESGRVDITIFNEVAKKTDEKPEGQKWKVVADDEAGVDGISVLDEKDKKLKEKLRKGAVVLELKTLIQDKEFMFRRLAGTGPDKGRAKVQIEGKSFLKMQKVKGEVQLPDEGHDEAGRRRMRGGESEQESQRADASEKPSEGDARADPSVNTKGTASSKGDGEEAGDAAIKMPSALSSQDVPGGGVGDLEEEKAVAKTGEETSESKGAPAPADQPPKPETAASSKDTPAAEAGDEKETGTKIGEVAIAINEPPKSDAAAGSKEDKKEDPGAAAAREDEESLHEVEV